MIILAVESSCDETSIALVENGKNVIENLVSSQIEIHSRYGGVVPEIASRQHVKIINIILEKIIEKFNLNKIDAVACTYGPGLQGSLLIGLIFAKTISWIYNKPFIPVNHLEGHIYSSFIENNIELPFITLLVSGGHTQIILFRDFEKYQIIGKTKDDAVGEAFDKVARLLDLSYPGGPEIDKLAQKGNKYAFKFTKPMPNTYDFSFSGIKTAVLYKLKELKENNIEINKNDIAASFNKVIAETLVEKLIKACREYNINRVSVVGGVSANTLIREELEEKCKENNIKMYLPSLKYCTDNAAMIATAAYYKLKNKPLDNFRNLDIEAISRVNIL
ncbi:MAG: tRNA N6-adenosine threonylcarbamoyltransferase [Candidatus Sericytochromatia bacterium]|nr:MAG: tRNA N6-adenosine threonylcarbamoyltransferase [Candidatus Sericytochromatia bacterium]